jgi:hypothetical protein
MSNLTIQVPSATNPEKQYLLTRHAETASWSCTCPAWKFQHAHAAGRTCKHITTLALDLAVHVAERAGVRV